MAAVIEMRNVTKEYRGIPAVKDVSFTLAEGEIHALLGENGAGKSTLTKIMAGVTAATSGEMLIDGRPVAFATPAEAMAGGVTMVFQENSLVPSMTVAQNLYLGDERFFNRLRGLYIAAQQFLQSMNFNVDPWATVATLGAAKKQMVEIARAVRQNARVIIFDEPTASLTPEEKHHFFSLVRRLKQRGVSIVFISHALEEALADFRPDHRPSRWRARHHRRHEDLRPRPDRPRHGRPQPVGEALWPRSVRRPAPAGEAGAQRPEPVHGPRRPQQLLHHLRRSDHRHLRPHRIRAHGNGEDRRRRR